MQHIKAITYLRAIAACLIFICHILFISGRFELSMWFNTGVPLFFIISAYLMSFKTFDNMEGGKRFYIRRIKSIFPSYWAYLTVVIAVLLLIGQPPKWDGALLYVLGMSGFAIHGVLGLGHMWFISILLICYFITPFLYRLSTSNNRYIAWGHLLIGIVVLFFLFTVVGYPSYGIHIGTYALIYCRFLYNNRNIAKRETLIWFVLAIVTSIVRLTLDRGIMEGDYNTYYYYDAWFQPLARFSLAMAIFCIAINGTQKIEGWSLRHKRTNKYIQYFSDISYEFYLTHQFIQLSVWEFFPSLHNGIGVLVWTLSSFMLTLINTVILRYIVSKIFILKYNRDSRLIPRI